MGADARVDQKRKKPESCDFFDFFACSGNARATLERRFAERRMAFEIDRVLADDPEADRNVILFDFGNVGGRAILRQPCQHLRFLSDGR